MKQTSLKQFLWQAIKPQVGLFILLSVLPSAWVLDQIIFPYCTKLIIDTITNYNGDRAQIYAHITPTIYLGLGVWIFLVTTYRVLDILEMKFTPKFQARIRNKMLQHVSRQSQQYFANEFSGRIANKINSMADSSWQVIYFINNHIYPPVITIGLAIYMLYSVSMPFALIMATFSITHFTICFYTAKRADLLARIHAQAKSSLNGAIVDSLSNISSIRLFARHAHEANYIQRHQNTEINAQQKLTFGLFKIRFLLEIPALLMMVSMVYYLIKGWQQGLISAGSFAFVIAVSFNIMAAIWRIGFMVPLFFKDIGVCINSLETVNTPWEIDDEPNANILKVENGIIEFRDVSFKYPHSQELFSHINITISAGEKIGLVGFSGSGKSTFINLILRTYDVQHGTILIDSQNIASVTQDSLHQAITMIPQDISLFNRTIFDNIHYGNLAASEAEVIAAAKQANCHEFIEQLPDGYHSMVGERGLKLSGGQRQRIAIARAILKNSPILILDEATSALDSITEKLIHESLQKLMQQRTTIAIAHRLSTLLSMDRILVFNHGVVIEQGNHEQLIALDGHYANLWRMQIGGFLPAEAIA